MRVVQFADYGPPDVLQLAEVATPDPRPGQVRIHVTASAVNPADYNWRSGMFREFLSVPLPHVLGYDVAGTVDALGEGVTGFQPGDRVVCLLDAMRKGGYAEYAVAEAAHVAKVAEGLSLELAATLPTAGLTGVQQILERVRPQPGETVLVTGAVGAVGRIALQTARQLGVRVVAAVRAQQRDLAVSLGASDVIVLGEATAPGLQFDHVADTVGGEQVAALCRLLKPGGRIITVATTPIDPQGLAAKPEFIAVHPDGPQLAALGEQVANGAISVAAPRILPLAEAAQAHRLVEAGGLGEKIVLRP
jgi:NADPH:quinone reductase-like Zn-dependent oxidoreductase